MVSLFFIQTNILRLKVLGGSDLNSEPGEHALEQLVEE